MQFDGKNLDQRIARYLRLLYFGKNSPVLRSTGVEMNGSVYFTLYGLDKIAAYLMISWDRTQNCSRDDITNAAERGLINVKTIGQATYYTITEKGEDLIRKLFD